MTDRNLAQLLLLHQRRADPELIEPQQRLRQCKPMNSKAAKYRFPLHPQIVLQAWRTSSGRGNNHAISLIAIFINSGEVQGQ